MSRSRLSSLRLSPVAPQLNGRLSLVGWWSHWVVLEEFVEGVPDDDVPKLRAEHVRRHVPLVSQKQMNRPRLLSLARPPIGAAEWASEVLDDRLKHLGHLPLAIGGSRGLVLRRENPNQRCEELERFCVKIHFKVG